MDAKNIIIISFAWAAVAIMISSIIYLQGPKNSSSVVAQQQVTQRHGSFLQNQMDKKSLKGDVSIENVQAMVCIDSLENPCSLPDNTTRPVVKIIE